MRLAISISFSSFHQELISWKPIGSPLWYPTGTEMAGVPVKLAGFVKSDARNAAEMSNRPPKIIKIFAKK